MRIVPIVEGTSEEASVPVLLRRIATDLGRPVEVVRPIRVKRQRIVKEGELERAVEIAARRAGPDGAILLLLDSDDHAARRLGPSLIARMRAARADRAHAAVLAEREFEAWFLAGIESLRGQRGVFANAMPPADPEKIRGAKEHLAGLTRSGYSEATDQPALAAVLDLTQARTRAASLDKLIRDVTTLLSGGASMRS